MAQLRQLYQNLQLGYWQIRILVLQPGKFGDRIKANLRVGDLLDRPEVRLAGDGTPVQYTALSYCWGNSEERSCEMECNGMTHSIGEEAYRALQHLRSGYDVSYIWIDTFCIDQANEDEKAHQVPAMLSVFSKASEVAVWLGEGNSDIEILIYRLQHQPSLATQRQCETFVGSLRKGGFEPESMGSVPSVGSATPETMVRAMRELLALPWFDRVWTKQEIWGAREVVLRYGNFSCNWRCFDIHTFECVVRSQSEMLCEPREISNACEELDIVRSRHKRADVSAVARTLVDDLCNPLLKDDENHELDIVNVIRRCSGSTCSDMRDHVYGLMGMSSAKKFEYHKDDKSKEMLSVNYSALQQPSDTFEDLARYIMGRDENLSILFLQGAFEQPQRGEGLPGPPLPTWVPDWRYHYGKLDWLLEKMHRPLSEKTRNVMLPKALEKISLRNPFIVRSRLPLLLKGFAFGKCLELLDSVVYKYEQSMKRAVLSTEFLNVSGFCA